MNGEELINLKRKSKELKEVRKELELYKIALKLACKDVFFPFQNIKDLKFSEKEKMRSVRNFYINLAKEIKEYEQ